MEISAHDDMDASLRLDGNAAAGLLAELFAFDATRARATCNGCQGTFAIGALMLYGQPTGAGAVFRCPACGGLMMCVTRTRGACCADLRGVCLLRVGDEARR